MIEIKATGDQPCKPPYNIMLHWDTINDLIIEQYAQYLAKYRKLITPGKKHDKK
jgi:hypothetical protein